MSRFFRRILSASAAAVTAAGLLSAMPFQAAAAGTFLRGDVDGDGAVSVPDAQTALNAYVRQLSGMTHGLTTEEYLAADINLDSVVDVTDAQTTLIYYLQNTVIDKPTEWSELLNLPADETWRAYLSWSEHQVFSIDFGLLGMNYDTLCSTLHTQLPALSDWTYWGEDLTWTEYTFDEKLTVFMFQNGRCVMIYSDLPKKTQEEITQYAELIYGSPAEGTAIDAARCTFSVIKEYYSDTNQDFARQQFESYDMDNAAPQPAWTNYLCWTADADVFSIDYSLLGLSHSALCTRLGVELPEPTDWPYWGNNLKWSEYDGFDGHSVAFMFRKGECVMIYNDQATALTAEKSAAITKAYGGLEVAVSNGDVVYQAYEEYYLEDGSYHLRQQFTLSESDAPADWHDCLQWNANGVFSITSGLLGMDYNTLCSALGVDLPEPTDWPYWGNNLKWSEYDGFDGYSAAFMFQNGKCVMIYNDQATALTAEKSAAITAVYGGLEASVSGGNATYKAYEEYYLEDGSYHLRQQFTSNDMI